MAQILKIVQIFLSILLAAAILVQVRGMGLGSVFGGEGNYYQTKRGAEKLIFKATIVIAILFLTLALINVII